jgi:hypothetical protein
MPTLLMSGGDKGSAALWLAIVAGLSLVMVGGAGSDVATRAARSGEGLEASGDELTLIIANAGDLNQLLPGVRISLVTTHGRVLELGETDRFGEVRIRKSELRPDSALLVTACSRWFFCGAVFVKDRELDRFDQFFLALAPLTVR